ncbi:DEKNAAC100051 [Brettanomyces naardenensis]|uniref:Prefoldin subunit 3 n=1 Tax=Brettanomyces naardenensis TaxID=13370 RepID=A0A448YFQ3_BRENA|nr:DEKNAAC100051 [Brettanomyces naardenensis]
MAKDRLSTGETNPRGIPQAIFIKSIEDFINPKTCTDDDVNNFLKELQMRMEQYRFMEESKKAALGNLDTKIPDIQKTLDICKYFKSKSEQIEEGGDIQEKDKQIEVNYQLNDTVYSKAVIDPKDIGSVRLWLGANIMVEYAIEEAIEMLAERLKTTIKGKENTLEDLEYLRSNITTMEVNTARVYNWDVQRRRTQNAEA